MSAALWSRVKLTLPLRICVSILKSSNDAKNIKWYTVIRVTGDIYRTYDQHKYEKIVNQTLFYILMHL